MSRSDEIRAEYLAQTRMLLSGHPAELQAFETLWIAGQFRQAYMSVDQTIRSLGLVQSPQNRKADEEFFWMLLY